MTTDDVADIRAGSFHLVAGVGRTAGAPYPIHHLQIGDIVAHVDDFLVAEPILDFQFLVCLDLDGTAEVDVLHTQIFIAFADTLGTGTREDDDA